MSAPDRVNASRKAPLFVEEIALAARDLTRMRQFYERVVGLAVLSESESGATLGAGGKPILRLIAAPGAERESPRSAGLFHLAILLPERVDLARWLRHAARIGQHLDGASDHGVSEAVYLDDPEGNGVEIYVDRPSTFWPRDRHGGLAMVTEPLDGPALDATLRETSSAWEGAPEGTVLGHVHLRVGDVAEAKRFYEDALGLEHMQDYPGAGFFSSGGYHHHIAGNVWRARGAGKRPEGVTGYVEMVLRADAVAMNRAAEGLAAARVAMTPTGNGFRVEDPWGLALRFRRAA